MSVAVGNPVIRLRPGRALFVLAAVGIAACSSRPPVPVSDRTGSVTQVEKFGKAKAPAAAASEGPTYTVKKGDTLFAIAIDQGQDYRDLAQWNNLDNPNRLLVGQTLRLSAPPPAVGAGDSGVQIKPITTAEPVALKLPDDTAPITPVAANAAPTIVLPTNSDLLKRGPKGGSQPYSEEALARQKEIDATFDRSRPATASPDVGATAAPPAPVAAVVTTPAAPAPAAPPVVAPPSAGAPVWAWPVPGKMLTPFSEGSNKGIDLAGKAGEPVTAAAAGKVSYVGSSLRGYGKMVVLKHGADYLSVYAHNNQVIVTEGQSVSAGQKIAELGSTDTDSPKLHFEIRRQGKPVDPLSLLPPR